MSNLQIALAILGGLVLAAIVAHGAWTSRKVAPRQASEPLPRTEPSLDGTAPYLSLIHI